MNNSKLLEPSKLMQCIRFWTRQSLTDCGDKGGNFNTELYLRYLEAKEKKW
jgi:hypothetical protein